MSKTVVLKRDKECKGSVRFSTGVDLSADVPVTNVYVSREMPGINEAKSVKVTVEIEGQ